MNTTSFLISKQLAEAGFESAINWAWVKLNGDLLRIHLSQFHLAHPKFEKIIAYDFETILEALPRGLRVEGKYWELGLHFREFGKSISYNNGSIAVYLEENESLADVAAKMWLKLKQEELV